MTPSKAEPSPVPARRAFIKTSWMACAVIAAFSAALVTGLFIPAYVDDILYLIITARAGYDGWGDVVPYSQCGPAHIGSLPWALIPGRALSWTVLALTDNLYTLRAISIAILLAWLAYTTWFIRTCLLPARPTLHILAAILSLAGLGLLPFSLELGRPETAMLFAVTFFASLPLLIEKHPAPPAMAVLATAVLFALEASWFLSSHPKAQFYTPLLLVSAWFMGRWNRAAGAALVCFTALASYDAWFGYWHFKLYCPDSPAVRQYMERVAVLPSMAQQSFFLFWTKLLSNVIACTSYIPQITFPKGGWWLPDIVPPKGSLITTPLKVALLADGALWVITTTLVSLVILRILFWVCRNVSIAARMGLFRIRQYPDALVPLCLLAAFLAHCAVESEKAFYSFSLVWGSLLLGGMTLAAFLTRHAAEPFDDQLQTPRNYRMLLAISLLSLCTLLVTYVPATLSLLHEDAPNGVIRGQRVKMNEINYEETKQHVLKAADACHIRPDASSRRVGVDQFTYLPLKATYRPLYPVFWLHEFEDPQKLLAFLHGWKSSGLVTLCAVLPPRVRPLAKETDGVCCLSGEQVDGANAQ